MSFLACAALAAGVAWLSHEIREGDVPIGKLDVAASALLVGARSEGLTRAMRALTFFGSLSFLVAATPAVVIGLWLARRHVSSLLFGGSVLGGLGLSALMKIVVARARPDRWPALVTETTLSFPSGHTLMATVFFGGLTAVVFHATKDRFRRGLAALAAGTAVLGVAVSRVYLGAHWATDTLAGMMAGLIWVLMFSASTESVTRLRQVVSKGTEPPVAARSPRA